MKVVMNFVAALAVVAGAAVAVAQSVDEQIAERLAPAGKTCMKGDECAAAAPAASASSGGTRSGEEVYKGACFSCHGTGAAGAPKFADAAAWAPRAEKGIDTLYTHAINGFNAMPARGLCMDCSDDEVKAAVDYMVENSK
ncbi:c-type cytochrome [Microbulbifer hydrolyticus]|uniref:Cytochrome c5 n=1 Tax=Microbulbifer hydrolyticus TaxID=48074 RepID=A0A6P1TG38_9GAMM|nr:c-type cytochrome [Microbulbifer hydrolyticus]MBB5211907.1 cytochrome c5 [Microbulbifer hydrolyticus]QHQ40510.1 cytochrome c5 family protein [Microbulbifer hydrolyticus]